MKYPNHITALDVIHNIQIECLHRCVYLASKTENLINDDQVEMILLSIKFNLPFLYTSIGTLNIQTTYVIVRLLLVTSARSSTSGLLKLPSL